MIDRFLGVAFDDLVDIFHVMEEFAIKKDGKSLRDRLVINGAYALSELQEENGRLKRAMKVIREYSSETRS